MINITLLQAFLEIARSGNMTLAAQKLGITQPALSNRIKLLEAEIGKSLFFRKKSGMEMNDFGKNFFSICRKLNQEVECVDNWIKDQNGQVAGILRLSVVSGAMNYIIPGFLEEFSQRYPETKFIIEENVSAVSEELVLNGSHDLGIITGKCKKGSLKTKLLFEHNDVLMVCSHNFERKSGRKITAGNIKPDEILWYVNPRSRATKKVAQSLGIVYLDSIGKYRLPDMETCKKYALKGLGVAVVAKMFVHDELKNKELLVVPGFKIKIPIYMISRNEAYQSPLITRFKEDFYGYCLKMDSKWKP